MGLAIGDEHLELAATVRRWVDTRQLLGQARALLDAPAEGRPPYWDEIGERGWLGLAVSESSGGQGYGVSELAVVLEELGRACWPGPVPVLGHRGAGRSIAGPPPPMSWPP